MIKIPPFKPDARTKLHIKWAAIIFIVVAAALLTFTSLSTNLCLELAFDIAAIAAIGKECWDKWVKPHLTGIAPKFDFWDMTVTIAAAGTLRSIAGTGYELVTFLKPYFI